jgi:hypothetical protein
VCTRSVRSEADSARVSAKKNRNNKVLASNQKRCERKKRRRDKIRIQKRAVTLTDRGQEAIKGYRKEIKEIEKEVTLQTAVGIVGKDMKVLQDGRRNKERNGKSAGYRPTPKCLGKDRLINTPTRLDHMKLHKGRTVSRPCASLRGPLRFPLTILRRRSLAVLIHEGPQRVHILRRRVRGIKLRLNTQ